MKITNIKATPINVPLKFTYLWSLGVFAGFSKLIIEVETDEGITGLGEAASASLIKDIENLKPLLIGKDPLDIIDCELTCLPEWKAANIVGRGGSTLKAFGAIDMALWDIKGKYFNMPIYKLLGGAYRKEISFTEYFGFEGIEQTDGTFVQDVSPEAVVDHCLKMKEEHGSTMFEGKLATTDNYWDDIDTVKMMRDKLGREAIIRLDANYGCSPATLRKVIYELEPYNIANLEDPATTFEEIAEIKKYTSIPISTHNCDLRRAVTVGAPDNFCGYPALFGGILNTIKFIGACEQMGKGFWFYSGDAGIATSVYLHLSAVCDNIHQPSQSLLRWQYMDVIEGGPFEVKNNVVPVPEGPGLGVTLDKKGLEMCHKHFVENGPCREYYNFKNPNHFGRFPRN